MPTKDLAPFYYISPQKKPLFNDKVWTYYRNLVSKRVKSENGKTGPPTNTATAPPQKFLLLLIQPFHWCWQNVHKKYSDGTIWPWGKTMDTIQYCTKYRDTIRYDIQSQNALPYVTVNSPRLMQRSHWRLRMRWHAFKRYQWSTAFKR